MKNEYYFISYRIDLGRSAPIFGQELTSMSPLEYVSFWKTIDDDYSERIILFAQEITEDEYKEYAAKINED